MLYATACAEQGPDANQLTNLYFEVGAGSDIVAAPAGFPGTYAFKIDPVNGQPTVDLYGWRGSLSQASKRNLLLVPFMFLFDAGFDSIVSIAELGGFGGGGTFSRRITLTTDERLQIQDTDDDEIGQTAAAYVTAGTAYRCLWLVDVRSPTNTHDVLWVYPAGGAWDKAIDVTGHGDIGGIGHLTFGTSIGKGLPTTGGPFYIAEGVVQTLNESPNDTPLGSITTRYKVANGVNSTGDDDFDAGAGAANPSHLNVDEIPHDFDATYDEGDTEGDHQSYAIEDADGGHTPLALHIAGVFRQGVIGQPAIDIQAYVYDGSSRDFSGARSSVAIAYSRLVALTTYNTINGTPVPDLTFNDLEAGVKITSLSGTSTLRLTQLGLVYLVEGPLSLPGDFPEIVLENRRRVGAQMT